MIIWTITFKTLRPSRPIQTAAISESLQKIWRTKLNPDSVKNLNKASITGLSPLPPQGKHTPGLFKVEFKGNKMIGLCSKSYCTELFATENSPTQVKFSMEGVNKGQVKNPVPYYEHILTTQQNFRTRNQGICAKNESMVMYKQDKNALTSFHLK